MPVQLMEKILTDPRKQNEIKNALNEIATHSVKEPGCQRFELFQDKKNPNHFYMYMIFDDQAAYDKHFYSDYVQPFVKKYGQDSELQFETVFFEKINLQG